MAEIASGPAGEVTKATISGIRAGVSRLVHFRETIQSLENKAKTLTSRKNDVMKLMDDAVIRNGERILQAADRWLESVEIAEVNAYMITDKAAQMKQYRGWGRTRIKLSKKAQAAIASIKELMDEMDQLRDISHPNHVQDLGSNGDFFANSGYQAFASREPIRNQILEALIDDNISLVWVYGVEGVGKTMLIKDLANQLKQINIFQDIAMVNLARKPQVQEIQGDVANQIDLKFNSNDIELSRAQRISHRLNNRYRKSLIILDAVQERVDLDAVGIPYKYGCQHCKILLTTRDEDLCKQMDTQSKMKLEVLSEEESFQLFRSKAGYAVNFPTQAVCRDISKGCGGIPLNIVRLGRELHGDLQY